MALEQTSEYLLKGLPVHQLKKDEAHPGAKIYRAILSQTGTNAPVATVIENTFSGHIVWTRSTDGIYLGTLANAFPQNKTAGYASGAAYVVGNFICTIGRYSSNIVMLSTFLPAIGLQADGWTEAHVKIMVFP